MSKEIISLVLIWQIFTLGTLILLIPSAKMKIAGTINPQITPNFKQKIKKYENPLAAICCAFISYLLLQLLCQTVVISLPLSIGAGAIPWMKSRAQEGKKQKSIQDAWPEALDHINSAIKSGVSISQALANLAERGPIVLSPFFKEYKSQVNTTGNLELALKNLCLSTQDPILKRLTQTILLVRQVGGAQVGSVLRTFTTFLRNDLTAKREIEMRHGWIANTARIASCAPWLLLIFLTFQPQTRTAYNTPTGAIVVLGGSLLIVIAYFWMNKSAQRASWQ
jgi:tight adherence protein B